MTKDWDFFPMTLTDANEYVQRHHRHSGPVAFAANFCIGLGYPPKNGSEDWDIVGVAIVGRPVARHLADGWTLEVNRLCTEGAEHACSALYGAAWRAARALGYRRVVTYTLASESGSSLRAAGWKVVGELKPRKGWSTPSRPRLDRGHDGQARLRWEVSA